MVFVFSACINGISSEHRFSSAKGSVYCEDVLVEEAFVV
jgi:hypothetical protein